MSFAEAWDTRQLPGCRDQNILCTDRPVQKTVAVTCVHFDLLDGGALVLSAILRSALLVFLLESPSCSSLAERQERVMALARASCASDDP